MVEQVAFDFDGLPEKDEKPITKMKRLEVGDSVVVSAVPDISDCVENYYYLNDFKGLKGTLVRINRQKVVSFEVEFSKGRFGIFYENEISKANTQRGVSNG